ncbi:hypothetical protein [Cohnella soli]|uniref:Uncharacterized protein n=1 Tax=Cohnella soli TaxID=425005 RepID=A0ABW0HTU4_9BACL
MKFTFEDLKELMTYSEISAIKITEREPVYVNVLNNDRSEENTKPLTNFPELSRDEVTALIEGLKIELGIPGDQRIIDAENKDGLRITVLWNESSDIPMILITRFVTLTKKTADFFPNQRLVLGN